MIDLDKLNNEIDSLLETETEQSLANWLHNKRYSSLKKLLGEGVFVSMEVKRAAIFSCKNSAVFSSKDEKTNNNPQNKLAA